MRSVRSPSFTLQLSALVLAAAACTGQIGGPRGMQGGPGGPSDPAGTGGSVGAGGSSADAGGPGRLRQLTRAQLEATVQELFGDSAAIGGTQQDSTRDGFASIGATYGSISVRGVEQFDDAILALLRPLFADPARRTALLGCTPTGIDDADCARRFISGFGRRAWRRPLSAGEQDRYVSLTLSAAKTLGDIYQGLLQAISGLLESPNFMYRVEIGTPDPAMAGMYRYPGWEMASRMSYFLWNSTPDAALLDAAQAGKLDAPDGVREQAARLLASPRARVGIATFGSELVELDNLVDAPKDDPRMTDTLRQAMMGEVGKLFEQMLEPAVDAMELFDTTRTFANAELATVYGLSGASSMGKDLVPVSLPANGPRSGLLGTGAILALYSGQNRTSPTARGVFVREKLLCQPMPQPPDGVNTNLAPDPSLTIRQKLEMHRAPGCRECHDLFDPIGFGFEVFDWIGAHRDKEGIQPIDPSGNLDTFTFENVRDLNSHLRGMAEVQRCVLQNLFRYSSGHLETDADRSRLEAWGELFTRSNRRLAEFLTEMVASDGFRIVSPAP